MWHVLGRRMPSEKHRPSWKSRPCKVNPVRAEDIVEDSGDPFVEEPVMFQHPGIIELYLLPGQGTPSLKISLFFL